MSSFYDDASLVVIPSGYKTSKVYAEKPTDGSGDLAFTRTGDTATRVNSAGIIEKVRTNLILQSNTLNVTWTTPNVSVTGGQTDPDGGTTAWLVTETVDGGSLRQAVTATGSLTFSFILKANTGLPAATLFCTDASQQAAFDLSNGTFSESGAVAKMVSLGNGWYRCSISFTASAASTLILFPSSGAGIGSCFATKAQLETSDIATDYIETTSAAVSVGPVANVPRLDYLGSTCPRLLLEPQRTNLVTYSEQFTNAVWTGGGATGVANQAVSPDGYTNADLIYPTVSGNFVGKYQNIAASTTGVVSCYVKQAGKRFAQLGTDNNATYTCAFDLQLGTVVRTATNYTATITSVGNGWFRITAAYVSSAAASYPFVGVSDNANGAVTVDGTNGLYVWGFQYETSASYATSYIPTLAASATRGADFYAKAGFGNTSTAGTLYYEFQNHQSPASASGYYMVCLFAGSTVTSTDFSPAESISIINNGLAVEGRNDGYATTLFSITPAINATVKVALRYDGTNVVAFVNGVKGTVFSDTAVGAKNALRVNNGQNATHATRQLLYFPSALTDAQLIELTTL